MTPTLGQLAMRDPARAALMGILPGANFGWDENADYSGEFAGPDMGAEFGYFGADAPPPPPPPPQHPNAMTHPYYPHAPHPGYGHHPQGGHPMHDPNAQHALAHQWREHERALAHERSRERLLNPNAGAHIKVERYDFSLKSGSCHRHYRCHLYESAASCHDSPPAPHLQCAGSRIRANRYHSGCQRFGYRWYGDRRVLVLCRCARLASQPADTLTC